MATAKATAKKRGRPAKAKSAAAAPASTVKKRGRPAKAKPVATKAAKGGKAGRPSKPAKPVAKMEKTTLALDPVVKLKETLAAKSEKDLSKALAKFSASWEKKRGAADAKKIKTAEKRAAVKAKAAAKAAAKRAKKK
jgi:colicin import membrane protein